MHQYDLIADWYAKERRTDPKAMGVPEVQQLASTLPQGAAVLDLGCGNGLPLTKLLVDAGFDVLGVDSSPNMLEKFRANLPNTRCICSPIQAADLPRESFDAAISWGMMFHLPLAEQRRAIENIASALKSGGHFLFASAAPEIANDNGIEGEPMNGVPFHYWSFTREGYRKVLEENGFTLVSVSQDEGKSVYYLAQKQ
jgi:SAM-dependent methyltransferase